MIRRYAAVLAPDHPLMGIGRVRLGRVLLLQRRYAEARDESLAGYQILAKQENPPARWLHSAREDLLAEYEALKRPDEVARYRAELGDTAAAR